MSVSSHTVRWANWASRYPADRLVAPAADWARGYTQFATELRGALGSDWVLEHVGSTSVPGLWAKPIIDIAIRLPRGRRLTDASAPLVRAGWTEPLEVGDHWATFMLTDGVRSAIGHVFGYEQWPEAHVRLFADWLRTHPSDRARYTALKRRLVANGVWGSDYTTGKGEFVLEVVNQARGARGLPMLDGPL